MAAGALIIDGLQYAAWSEAVFRQMRAGGVCAVHVTVGYHEGFREVVGNLIAWNRRFRDFAHLIVPGRGAEDVRRARADGRTAIFFGLQNPLPLSADLGLVEILHALGIRFCQLAYNQQSLLGTGYLETEDGGLTRFGRNVIAEMNRLGLAIDLSHAGQRTARAAIDASARPVAITHANPASWHPIPRNVPDEVLAPLAARGGMIGLSLYPHHLKDGSACSLKSFCAMAAQLAERIGMEHIGLGSDLCQGQPDAVLGWMRAGRWQRPGPADVAARFPPQPEWFRDNRDFGKIAAGLAEAGLADPEVAAVMGGNWLRFMDEAFRPGQDDGS